MVLCHVTVEDIPGFQHLEALGALISLAQLMLRFQMSFHVISFVGNVRFGHMAEGADKFPIVRTDSMPLHQVCMTTRSRNAPQAYTQLHCICPISTVQSVVVQGISSFESGALARRALVPCRELVLGFEVGFHVVPLGCYIGL